MRDLDQIGRTAGRYLRRRKHFSRWALVCLVSVSFLALALPAGAQDLAFRLDPARAPSLFAAVQNNDLAAVSSAIKNGKNVTETDEFGRTPLDLAMEMGHFEVAQALMQARRAEIDRLTKSEEQVQQDAAVAVPPSQVPQVLPVAQTDVSPDPEDAPVQAQIQAVTHLAEAADMLTGAAHRISTAAALSPGQITSGSAIQLAEAAAKLAAAADELVEAVQSGGRNAPRPDLMAEAPPAQPAKDVEPETVQTVAATEETAASIETAALIPAEPVETRTLEQAAAVTFRPTPRRKPAPPAPVVVARIEPPAPAQMEIIDARPVPPVSVRPLEAVDLVAPPRDEAPIPAQTEDDGPVGSLLAGIGRVLGVTDDSPEPNEGPIQQALRERQAAPAPSVRPEKEAPVIQRSTARAPIIQRLGDNAPPPVPALPEIVRETPLETASAPVLPIASVDPVAPEPVASETPAPQAAGPKPSVDAVHELPAEETRLLPQQDASGMPIQRLRDALQGVHLTLGDSVAMGHPQRRYGADEPSACISKRQRHSAFCVVPVDWPAEIADAFSVNTILYQGSRALARYDRDAAVHIHAIFDSGAYNRVLSFLRGRFGSPTDEWRRVVAPFGKPRQANPTYVWRSRDPETQQISVLEVRKFDDARAVFPDMEHGSVRLYMAGGPTVFPAVTAIDIMSIDWAARSDPVAPDGNALANTLPVSR